MLTFHLEESVFSFSHCSTKFELHAYFKQLHFLIISYPAFFPDNISWMFKFYLLLTPCSISD